MKRGNAYRIPFVGLKIGFHHFDFHLTRAFFESFDHSEIEEADIRADVELEKRLNMLIFHFSLSGSVMVPCDRCGETISQAMKGQNELIVKFGDVTGSSDEDVLVLGPSEFEVDLTQYLYEFAHLALPARRVHPDIQDCNQDVLKELEKYRVEQDSDSEWISMKDMELESGSEADNDEEE